MKSRAEEVEDVQREAQVLEFRKAGLTFAQIAPLCDPPYADHTGPLKAFKRAMAKTIGEPAAELRELEVIRLDQLWRTWYPKAIAGTSKAALDACLDIIEKRAKLLGLYAPTRVSMTVTDEMTAEIERLAAELAVQDPTALERLDALPIGAGPDQTPDPERTDP